MKLQKEGNIHALLKGSYLGLARAVTCVTGSRGSVSGVIKKSRWKA